MGETIQIHLSGKGFSGRGVRLRELDADEVDTAGRIAARLVGSDATNAEYAQRRNRECVARMIAEVTEKAGLAEKDLTTAKWVRITQQDLEDEKGAKRLAALFTAKDMQVLTRFFRQRHDVTEEELAAIEGKAVAVSGD